MPRIRVADSYYHFGDGGYFDNDGTSTALEFLYYALNPGGVPPVGQETRSAALRLPVLLIEIRDSSNPTADGWPEDLKHQSTSNNGKNPKDWGPSNQLAGPIETFYNAGHSSVTRRNRRELAFLEGALREQAEVSRVVFDYQGDANEVQALSWHLTTKQLEDIGNELEKQHIKDSAQAALVWYRAALKGECAPKTASLLPGNEPCVRQGNPH